MSNLILEVVFRIYLSVVAFICIFNAGIQYAGDNATISLYMIATGALIGWTAFRWVK